MAVIQAGTLGLAEWFDLGTYTPVLTAVTTNPTLGSGSSQTGWWQRANNMIIGGASIQFGTSGVAAGSGSYFISLPFPADTTFMIASDVVGSASPLGVLTVRDSSAPAFDGGWCQLASSGSTLLLRVTAGTVSNSVPWVWAASDRLNVNFAYQADPASL